MGRKEDSKIPGAAGTVAFIYEKNFSKMVPVFVGEKAKSKANIMARLVSVSPRNDPAKGRTRAAFNSANPGGI